MPVDIEALLNELRNDSSFINNVTFWGVRERQDARFGEVPQEVHQELKKYLAHAGIHKLYTHQIETYRAVS